MNNSPLVKVFANLGSLTVIKTLYSILYVKINTFKFWIDIVNFNTEWKWKQLGLLKKINISSKKKINVRKGVGITMS